MKTSPVQSVEDFCKVLKAIGNTNRLSILTQLSEGELSVGQIEASLCIKQPNLSHELKKLRDLGLVSTRRDSKVIHYAIANNQVMTLIAGLSQLRAMTVENETVAMQPIINTELPDQQASGQRLSESPVSQRRNGEYGQFPVIQH